MTGPPAVRLLVCGAADRGDDGVALAAAATLLPTLDGRQRAVLEVRRCGQLQPDDLLSLPDDTAALIVDAAHGVTPGSVVVVPLADLVAANDLPSPRSSRGRSIAQLLLAAAARRDAPLRGTFIGIGGRRFGFGQPLSRCVRAALPELRRAIAEEIDRLAELRVGVG